MGGDNIITKVQYGPFKAGVKIGGKLARCYAVGVNKRKKEVSCWIASELGQKFAVCLDKEETSYYCRPDITLDGIKFTFVPLEKIAEKNCVYSHVSTSKTTERPFVFGTLNVTDNEALVEAMLLKNPTEAMEGNLGEIKLTIHRAVYIVREKIRKESWDSEESESESSDDDSEDDDESDSDSDHVREEVQDTNGISAKKSPGGEAESVPEIRIVHESSMKATIIPHQIKFGEKITKEIPVRKEAPLVRALGRPNVLERVRAETSKARQANNKPEKPAPVSCREVKERLVTFIFNYRPIENLRADGIAPRIIGLNIPALPAVAPPLEAPLPEVHQAPITISLVDTVDEEENGQLPLGIEDAPTSDDAPQLSGARESETNVPPAAPEPSIANDCNPPLTTPALTESESAPHPPMRFPSPDEEKPLIIPDLKTAEEDEINSQIKQLQSRLDEVRSKKRHIEEASAVTSKRVKTENVEHFFPAGEIIDIALDS